MSTQSGMLPNAHVRFVPILVILGVVNIIYAALTSFAQRNLKRPIAYSSISHMGFALIGIASFTDLGLSGAVLQMVSHGLIGASLFFLVGATDDRTHIQRTSNASLNANRYPYAQDKIEEQY